MLVADNGPDDAGGRYPGMGLTRQGKSFNGYQSQPDPSVGYTGANGPNSSGHRDGYSSAQLDGSHMPIQWLVTALMTGHPLYADMAALQANACQLYSNNSETLGNRTYSNIAGLGQQLRGSGWGLRAYDFAESYTPAARPEAAVIAKALDTVAQWGAHRVVTAAPVDLKMGRIGHVGSGGGKDVGFFFLIFMAAVNFALWRGRRPMLRTYAAGLANQQLGVINDARADGGTGYVAGGYHPNCADANGVTYPDLRTMIANEADFGRPCRRSPQPGSRPGNSRRMTHSRR